MYKKTIFTEDEMLDKYSNNPRHYSENRIAWLKFNKEEDELFEECYGNEDNIHKIADRLIPLLNKKIAKITNKIKIARIVRMDYDENLVFVVEYL